MHWLVKLFASGFYSGYSPVASGTVGSAVAVAIYFIPGFEQPAVMITVILVSLVLGIKASRVMEGRYGHDPGEVTIDEMVGMWVSLLFMPKDWLVVAIAFVLFRIFDIIKPYPARKFDTVTGGIGIMMDDVIAGIYTWVTFHAFAHLIHALEIIE